MVSKNNRIDEIDIIKALGIICMVAGHSGAPFTKFIYLFHMAVFFIASGFVFKDVSSDSLGNVMKSIKKKLKQLWIPFFLWNCVFVLFQNLFIKVNVYSNNSELYNYVTGKYVRMTEPLIGKQKLLLILKGAFFSSGTEMGGAFWFIRILFMISVGYCLADYFTKRVLKKNVHLIQSLISLLLLSFGYLCSLNKISLCGIEKAASFYCLYHMGHLLGIYKKNKRNWKYYGTILVVSFIILIILNNKGYIALDENYYKNSIFLLASSLSGWAYLYSISYFIKQMNFSRKIFTLIGGNTLMIMILHFLSMKVVAAIIVVVYNLSAVCVAAFPNLYGEKGLWWLAYTIVGVFVPVSVNMLYKNAVVRVRNCFNKYV